MAFTNYRFPFDTCECVSKNPYAAQPFSALINAISTLLLSSLCTLFSPCIEVTAVLSTYAMFEAWHTWSHMQHVPGKLQKRVVHVLGLTMAFVTLWMIQSLSCNAAFTPLFLSVLIVLISLDVVTIITQNDFAGIATGLSIFAWVVAGRWEILPVFVRDALVWLLPGVGALLLLFINEAINCEKLLKWRRLPYHAIIEIWGFALFAYVSVIWIKWGNMSKHC